MENMSTSIKKGNGSTSRIAHRAAKARRMERHQRQVFIIFAVSQVKFAVFGAQFAATVLQLGNNAPFAHPIDTLGNSTHER